MTDIAERLGNLIECEMDKAQCELYATAKAEIEKLRMQLADHGETITRLETEIERLHKIELQFIALQEERVRWFADNEWLTADNERLRAALQRIDGINDNPACFNPMIEEVLRRALEPKPCPHWPGCGCGTQRGPHTCEHKP